MNVLLNDDIRDNISIWFSQLQFSICSSLFIIEDSYINKECYSVISHPSFIPKQWNRSGGGSGISMLMHGNVFEKAGINVSTVFGEIHDSRMFAAGSKFFWVSGISIVIHPRNPFVPAIHMNIRCFSTDVISFVAGVIDLNPIYQYEDDIRYFHESLKKICNTYNASYYDKFSKQCSEYFYIPHRQEERGVGGIFFDEMQFNDISWQFCKDIGSAFIDIYSEIVNRRADIDWSKHDRDYQLVSRGRYAEFNLIYDRGIKFGLANGANIDCMFMSMPPLVAW